MLQGLDVSHHNGRVNWRAVYNAGARFAILKATEGVNFVDNTFARNLREARAAGLYCGAYHFFLPTGDAVAQANHLLRTVKEAVGAATVKETFHHLLVPFLDVEVAGGMSRDALVNSVLAFIKHVQAKLGRGMVDYTYRSFIAEHFAGAGQAKWLAGYPVWIADYSMDPDKGGKPRVPAPLHPATFWQFTDRGTWPGVPGEGTVDLDVFLGDVEDMERLVIQ